MKKKILSVILAASMILGLFVVPTVASAATSETYNLEDYRSEAGYVAPTKDGYIFAGWYYDAEFENAVAYDDVDGEAYAKFVDPAVFGVKFQYKEGTNSMSDITNLRMITSVDSENYYSVKFAVSVDGAEAVELAADAIYSTLYGYVDGEANPYEATIFAADSKYFAVQKVTDIVAANFAKSIEVTPVFETMDGTVVEGVARTITIAGTVPVATITVDAQAANNGLGFTTTGADALPVGVMTAVEGGVYVNGQLSETATLEKIAANAYVINGVGATADTIIKIDGKFGTATTFAEIAVAFGYEGQYSRWLMAKTLFSNLSTYDEVHGARSDKELFLPYSYGGATVKGVKTGLPTNKPYTYPAVSKFTVEEGLETWTAQYAFNIYTADYLRVHSDGQSLGTKLNVGTILTLDGAIMTNFGYAPNEYPFYVEGLSLILTENGWKKYEKPTADRTLVNVNSFNDVNGDVGHGQLVVLTYDKADGEQAGGRYYTPISGGVYVNGATVPTSLNIEAAGGYLFMYNEESTYGLSTFVSNGITVQEGTKIYINGIFAYDGNPDDAHGTFEIDGIHLVYTKGAWREYTGNTVTFEKHSVNDTNIVLGGDSASKYLIKDGSGRYMPCSVSAAKVYVNGQEADVRLMPTDLAWNGLTYIPYATGTFGWGCIDEVLAAQGTTLQAGTTFELGEGLYYHTGLGDSTRVWVTGIKLEYQGDAIWTVVE